jgi:acyl-CoA synthetase (AMP-forming)/AMP-acid ligase II
VYGDTSVPLIATTIGRQFDAVVRQHGPREALVTDRVRWSYDELHRRAQRLAAGFLRLGLSRGDRVGILAGNCAEWCVRACVVGRVRVC